MDADLLQSATVEMSIKVSALDSCAPRIAQERRLVEGLRLHRSVGRLTTGSCQECTPSRKLRATASVRAMQAVALPADK